MANVQQLWLSAGLLVTHGWDPALVTERLLLKPSYFRSVDPNQKAEWPRRLSILRILGLRGVWRIHTKSKLRNIVRISRSVLCFWYKEICWKFIWTRPSVQWSLEELLCIDTLLGKTLSRPCRIQATCWGIFEVSMVWFCLSSKLGCKCNSKKNHR